MYRIRIRGLRLCAIFPLLSGWQGQSQLARGASDHAFYTVSTSAEGQEPSFPDTFYGSNWIPLRSETHGFADMTGFETAVVNDLSREERRLKFGSWMGLAYEQADENYEAKYHLEDLQGRGRVVTRLEARSPAVDAAKVSSALLWQRRATPENGHFRVVVATRSPRTREARLGARLRSLDSPETLPQEAEIVLPVTPDTTEFSLLVKTASPPGRYDLELRVTGPGDASCASDHLPVYVYPAGG